MPKKAYKIVRGALVFTPKHFWKMNESVVFMQLGFNHKVSRDRNGVPNIVREHHARAIHTDHFIIHQQRPARIARIYWGIDLIHAQLLSRNNTFCDFQIILPKRKAERIRLGARLNNVGRLQTGVHQSGVELTVRFVLVVVNFQNGQIKKRTDSHNLSDVLSLAFTRNLYVDMRGIRNDMGAC
jgi:hypothetical protein